MSAGHFSAGGIYDRPRQMIGIEDRIQALLFHGRIAGVLVADFPKYLTFDGPGYSGKCPEVSTDYIFVAAGFSAHK